MQRLGGVPDDTQSTLPQQDHGHGSATVITGNVVGSNVAGGSIYQIHNTYCQHSGEAKSPEKKTCVLPVEKLQRLTKQRAEEVAGERPVLYMLDRPIDIVNLQLSTDLSRPDEAIWSSGHYNQRTEFEEIMKKKKGNISLDKVFDHAQSTAKKDSMHQKSEAAKTKYICRHGNTVTFLGQAGIGKTTLTRIIVQKILDKKILPSTKYIFYVPFREMRFAEKTTFARLILTGIGYTLDETPLSEEEVMRILGEGEDVTLIHDAFDEADTLALKTAGNFPPRNVLTDVETADIHMRRLLSAQLLPKAIKILTSRPLQFMDMSSDIRPTCVIDVLGLDEEDQLNLCKQICHNDAVFVKIQKYLRENPDIAASCYVAIKCILIMCVLNKCVVENNEVDIESLTHIFIEVLDAYVCGEHVKETKDLLKLAEVALAVFLQGKFSFTQQELQNAGIHRTSVEAFLVPYTHPQYRFHVKILDGKKGFYFSHLIWQELFSAVYLLLKTPLEEFRSHIDHLHESRWEVVAKFMYGLCNDRVYCQVKTIFNIHDRDTWEAKKNMLKAMAMEGMETVNSDNTLKLLTLCSWLREMKDAAVNRDVLQYWSRDVNLTGTIISTDVPNLAYAFRSVNERITLRICSMIGKGHRFRRNLTKQVRFGQGCFEALLTSLAGANLQLLEIRRSLGKGHLELLSNLVSRVNALILNDCSLTASDVDVVATHLVNRSSSISLLDLSHNGIGDEGVFSIVKALRMVHNLILSSCGLTERGISGIADTCLRGNIQMALLDLSKNRVGEAGASALGKALHKIDRLHLSGCGLTSKGITTLARACQELRKPLTLLDLSLNNIGDEAASFLVKSLPKIDGLKLSDCGLSAKSVRILVEGCQARKRNLTFLDLSDNNIGDEAASFLVKSLPKIDSLNISSCELSAKSVRILVEGCQARKRNTFLEMCSVKQHLMPWPVA